MGLAFALELVTRAGDRKSEGSDVIALVRSASRDMFICGREQFPESVKLVVPALLYLIQNNLTFVALANLNVGLYQVTNQGKLLTTALLSRVMLKKEISTVQYLSIALLGFGVAFIHLSEHKAEETSSEIAPEGQDQLLGLVAMLVCCLTSSFSGVHYEYVLKESPSQLSVHTRNFHLASWSLVFAILLILFNDSDRVLEYGLFAGFNNLVVLVVMAQGMTGLAVSMIIKYADNVLKGFAIAIAAVLSTLLSVPLFGARISLSFGVGAAMVILAVKGYHSYPAIEESANTAKHLGNQHKRTQKPFKIRVSGSSLMALCAMAYTIHICMLYHKIEWIETSAQMAPLHSLSTLQNQKNNTASISKEGFHTKVIKPTRHQERKQQDYLASCRSSMNCCESSIRNPGDKLDIVIPYRVRPVTDTSLKYELRSFEKSGLLDYVGKVFIIAENAGDVEIIESRYQRYINGTQSEPETSQLRVLAMDDIKVPFATKKFKENVKLGKSHYSPYLPLTSEYFLLVPDDIIMLKNYTRDIWFDPEKKLPHAHSFGGWHGGNTRGFSNIAELHGVNFLNRCSMRYAIEKYNVTKPEDLSPTAAALGLMKKENLLAGFYGYSSGQFTELAPYHAVFFRECHTNGGCRTPPTSQIFTNIQGNGISDEYPKDAKLEKLFGDWFRNTFPIPSRFE